MSDETQAGQEQGLRSITEDDKDTVAEFYERAEKVQSAEDLRLLLQHLANFHHDYGTVVHAVAAMALAGAHAMNRAPGAGITGFQAGCVMWEFIKRWQHIDGPMRLVQYEDLLFPQMAEKFDKVLSAETWKWLQERARYMLNEHPSRGLAVDDVRRHWLSIAEGRVPFGYRVRDDA